MNIKTKSSYRITLNLSAEELDNLITALELIIDLDPLDNPNPLLVQLYQTLNRTQEQR